VGIFDEVHASGEDARYMKYMKYKVEESGIDIIIRIGLLYAHHQQQIDVVADVMLM
jgi:hypothetical protein